MRAPRHTPHACTRLAHGDEPLALIPVRLGVQPQRGGHLVAAAHTASTEVSRDANARLVRSAASGARRTHITSRQGRSLGAKSKHASSSLGSSTCLLRRTSQRRARQRGARAVRRAPDQLLGVRLEDSPRLCRALLRNLHSSVCGQQRSERTWREEGCGTGAPVMPALLRPSSSLRTLCSMLPSSPAAAGFATRCGGGAAATQRQRARRRLRALRLRRDAHLQRRPLCPALPKGRACA